MKPDKTSFQRILALIGQLVSFAVVGTVFVLAVRMTVDAKTPFDYVSAVATAITFSLLLKAITVNPQ